MRGLPCAACHALLRASPPCAPPPNFQIPKISSPNPTIPQVWIPAVRAAQTRVRCIAVPPAHSLPPLHTSTSKHDPPPQVFGSCPHLFALRALLKLARPVPLLRLLRDVPLPLRARVPLLDVCGAHQRNARCHTCGCGGVMQPKRGWGV
eukprot:355236-Chlamydomonas_euryale.AAC.10